MLFRSDWTKFRKIGSFGDVSGYENTLFTATGDLTIGDILTSELDDLDLEREIADFIIQKLKEKKLYTYKEYPTYRPSKYGLQLQTVKSDLTPAGTEIVGPSDPRFIRGVEIIKELSFSSVFSDLNLNIDLKDASVLPTPYFYFYYGIGDNPNQWSGPIASQLVNARYNYSVDNGKKSIDMEFATTYNFPAFSKLSLDKRGFLTSIAPKFRGAQIFEASPGKAATLVKYRTKYLHSVVTGVIKDYIKTCVRSEEHTSEL